MLPPLLTHALSLSLSLLCISPFTSALPQITRTGKYLYDPSGNRFSIKGAAYQPEGVLAASSEANDANGGFPEPSSFLDPLSSPANCTRDIPYLKQLGVNAVRVYSVNASIDHDSCMSALSSAGIYVLYISDLPPTAREWELSALADKVDRLDVSLPLNGSIDRSVPAWTTNLLDQYITTINAFLKYDNLLAFNIGNEVINLPSNTNAAPYVKAAARDIKAYLQSVNSSALVGYSAVDGDADFRNTLAEYLTCGNDSISVDIYGLNNYEWCGNETLQTSHWDVITSGFSQIPVATYMSEFGCIMSPPRLWTEVQALYTSPVSDVFSGGVAFSYFPTSDGYGMVTFSADGSTVQTSGDFTRLSAEYNATSLPTSPAKSAATVTTIGCPAQNASLLASTTIPPTPDESACNCVDSNALACRAKPSTVDDPIIVGMLTDYACSLLGSSGAGSSCDAIGGNGSSGVYGSLSMCSPGIKLSYAMSAYYEFNPIDSSCDFGGNATLSSTRPNTAQDASSSAASCLNAVPSGGVFTPTALSASATASSTSSGTSASGSSAASPPKAKSSSSIRVDTSGLSLLVGVLGVWFGAAWVPL